MIPEIGQIALILALCMAVTQATFPLIGAARSIPSWIDLARPLSLAQLLFVLIAFLCLVASFVNNDFSVAYFAHNTNNKKPLVYRISAVWGGHEGSILLWSFVLSLWSGAVALLSRSIPGNMIARVLGVMGLVSAGFLLFMLFTSNPFERLWPIPFDGRDLNPLLQDPGMAIHPPMLYMGYVGFSVAFAFAIAAMLSGQLDTAWTRWARPWTTVAWLFLTLGIALGSWWAYYELGWGGWWFWDPVENASFMPWLVGTALLHSMAVTEKRGTFKAWTVLLSVFAFSFSLLGTFLVRSGVLTSVHAFATDPTRGLFILIFLAVVIGGSLLLFAIRAPKLRSASDFDWFSRESALLINNLLLLVAAASILLGTLYPLLIDALGKGKLSVGPPYFNSVFIPITAPLALLIGIGTMVRWKKDDPMRLVRALRITLFISLLIGLLSPLLMPFYSGQAAIGLVLAAWTALSTLQQLYQRAAGGQSTWHRLRAIPAGFYGMTLAHLGVAVFIVGITLTSVYSTEKDLRMAPGEQYQLGGYLFQFEGVKKVAGVNYDASEGRVRVSRNGQPVALLEPQKRIYHVRTMPMTEAAIDPGLLRDLFVALGEPLGKHGAWSLRIYHKPFIRWIWMGALLMGLGGAVAASDRRYYRAKAADRPTATQPTSITVEAA